MENHYEKTLRFAEFLTDRDEDVFFFYESDREMAIDKCYYVTKQPADDYVEITVYDINDDVIFESELSRSMIAKPDYVELCFGVIFNMLKISILELEDEANINIIRNKKLLGLS